MKRLFIVPLLLAATALFGQVSVGVTIGAPPPLRVLKVRPAAPGPDYIWVEGYWYPVNGHYKWHEGYWTRPPYAGAHWIAPNHDGSHWFEGYWEGDRGKVRHEHEWDHSHNRDYHHDHDR